MISENCMQYLCKVKLKLKCLFKKSILEGPQFHTLKLMEFKTERMSKQKKSIPPKVKYYKHQMKPKPEIRHV